MLTERPLRLQFIRGRAEGSHQKKMGVSRGKVGKRFSIDEQRAYEARLFRGDGDGAPRAPSAQERDHVEAVEAAARDIKRTAETVPGKAEELRELIAVVEARSAERRRAGGDAPAGDGDGGSSAPGSAQSHVVQPVARLAQHLSQTESLVDFLGGAGDP